ncbi:MAG: hypothetical protein RL180_131, partial [Pseudomonadota bacterium]
MGMTEAEVSREQKLARVRMEPHWKQALEDPLVSDSFQQLREFIKTRQEQGETIYPPASLIFNAFSRTPLP